MLVQVVSSLKLYIVMVSEMCGRGWYELVTGCCKPSIMVEVEVREG